ncbi:hypothetical protein [Azospirillum soli]|uniref:hypothetical protein n=1 Tax=Azospirillum soli TaxID=1304799 RepID=UPI001AE7BB3D|nr:hypothetical protein [Azospirillum soli]MBP2312618.1 hypothetical protein [Azospirillum soli]
MLVDKRTAPLGPADDDEMKRAFYAAQLETVEETIARLDEEKRRQEKLCVWLKAELAKLNPATQNPQTVESPVSSAPVQSSEDEHLVVPDEPFYPDVPTRLRPESEFWSRMYVLIPQAPAKGWTPTQLTFVAQKERSDLTNKRVRNQLDRWRKRGRIEHVDGLWRRPTPSPDQQTEEGGPM